MTVSLVAFKAKVSNGVVSNAPVADNPDANVTAYAQHVIDLAQLTTDGASPTQAHCTSAVASWVTVKAAIDAGVTNAGHGVTVIFDKTDITKAEQLRQIFNQFIVDAIGNGYVTG